MTRRPLLVLLFGIAGMACGGPSEEAIDTYCGVVARTQQAIDGLPPGATTSNNLDIVRRAADTYRRALEQQAEAAPGELAEAYQTLTEGRTEGLSDQERGRAERAREDAVRMIDQFQDEQC